MERQPICHSVRHVTMHVRGIFKVFPEEGRRRGGRLNGDKGQASRNRNTVAEECCVVWSLAAPG